MFSGNGSGFKYRDGRTLTRTRFAAAVWLGKSEIYLCAVEGMVRGVVEKAVASLGRGSFPRVAPPQGPHIALGADEGTGHGMECTGLYICHTLTQGNSPVV